MTAFTIEGTYRGGPYTLLIDTDHDGDGVIAHAAPRDVLTAIEGAALTGAEALATPTGPAYKVTLDDPQSILAWAVENTRVQRTAGDVPTIVPEEPTAPGVRIVY